MVIPADWKEVRLGEIYEVKSSKRVLQSEWRQIGVPFFRGREVSELASRGKVNNDLFIDMTHYERLRRNYGVPRIDDLLLTAIGTIGNAYRVKTTEPFYFKDASVIWLSGRGGVVGSYVEHWMKSKGFRDQLPSDNGTTVDTLTIGFTAGMRVILPPLKEQEAIAEALSDADAAIESLDDLIAKKRDVKQATMQQLLTGRTRLPGFTADWKEVSLGAHAAFFKGNGLSKSQLIDDGPQQCVHYGELFTHYGPVIETVTSKCVAFEGSFKSLAGDVLMPGSDVTPRGLATASAIKVSDVVLGGDVIVIRTKPTSLYGPFLSNFIRMSKACVLRLVKGSTVYHIHAKDLANLEVLMPPLKEQEAIAEALTVIDDELEALTEQVSKMRMVKEGMMQDLLTGKVRLV